ncbi:hypothetical protein SCHPADRAFT_933913 [Schizopora paradoxa]|uniref:MYND-type domain-containing protein n=1 Tax=Schizopora paradoxa TaxID=27342 RepID=A0A0H2QZE9_9AGAM|nr:hypothetical protein SCHPADRAFT_933913 [Schizopora paradoxa]
MPPTYAADAIQALSSLPDSLADEVEVADMHRSLEVTVTSNSASDTYILFQELPFAISPSNAPPIAIASDILPQSPTISLQAHATRNETASETNHAQLFIGDSERTERTTSSENEMESDPAQVFVEGSMENNIVSNTIVANVTLNDENDELAVQLMDVLVDVATRWIVGNPAEAVRFSLESDSSIYLAVHTVSFHIHHIDEHHLPNIIRIFASSINFLCNNVPIDGRGQLRLANLATIVAALSSLDTTFWVSNPDVRDVMIDTFPRLHAWMDILADLVTFFRPPVQTPPQRLQALYLIRNGLWVLRSVGIAGTHFAGNITVWNSIYAMWFRSRDLSVEEEGWVAFNFNTARDVFAMNHGANAGLGFLQNLLAVVQEHRFKVDEVLLVSLSRIHRAMEPGTEPQSIVFVHQHLLVVLALIDDNGEFGESEDSPFHHAFFVHGGLKFVLEIMTSFIDAIRWTVVDACVKIVAAFLRRTRSHTVFRAALQSKLIESLMRISCNSREISTEGRECVVFLVSTFLPEIMLSQSVLALSGDMVKPDAELWGINKCVYKEEWNHLMRIRRHFFYAYLNADFGEQRRCGNPACISEHSLERPIQLCSACCFKGYCSTSCQKEAWRKYGHKRYCAVIQRIMLNLQMDASDVYHLFRHAQKLVQSHIDKKRIGSRNKASFRISYALQFKPPSTGTNAVTRSRRSMFLVVEEFQRKAAEDEELLSAQDCFGGANDFCAEVQLVFTRYFVQHSVTFLCGFRIGTERLFDLDMDEKNST